MSRTVKQPYRKSRAVDAQCRCHGSCGWCLGNRMHKNDIHPDVKEELKLMEEENEDIQFIERLESSTTDEETANKIREYLVNKGVWDEDKDSSN